MFTVLSNWIRALLAKHNTILNTFTLPKYEQIVYELFYQYLSSFTGEIGEALIVVGSLLE